MTSNRIPQPSPKEALILKMLISTRKEWYGLELIDASQGQLKRGTIYVTLGRMEEKGYVESRRENSDEAPSPIPRRLYKPTGFGVKVLAAYEQYARHLERAAFA